VAQIVGDLWLCNNYKPAQPAVCWPLLSGVGALWDCVPMSAVVWAADGGVPLGAVPVLSWCGQVSLGGKQ